MKRYCLVLILCAGCFAQVAGDANSRYQTPEDRARMASRLDGPDRDARQKPKELMEALALQPGTTVADLGTGVGYLLPYLSAAVGPSGHVLAQDIFPDFLEKAREKAAKEKLANVTFFQGTEKNPNLPANSADVVLILDAYHHFDYPREMLEGIAKALGTGGRLVIVDYYKDGFGDPNHIRLDVGGVIEEIEANGFQLVSKADHIPQRQYLIVLKKK